MCSISCCDAVLWGINNFPLAVKSKQLLLAGVAGAVCVLMTAEVSSRLVVSQLMFLLYSSCPLYPRAA